MLLLSQIISPERSRGYYVSAKTLPLSQVGKAQDFDSCIPLVRVQQGQPRLLMECAKTLISTMLFRIVMQTTKTGTDKCKAGLYATLII